MTSTNSKAYSAPMYKGKWTPEEEEYVDGLIVEFRAGNLPIKEGITLRSFLAKELGCDGKRITKKFENSGYHGRLVFTPGSTFVPPNEARLRKERMQDLKKRFLASRQALADEKRWKSARRKASRKKTKTMIPNVTPVNQGAQTGPSPADTREAVSAAIAAIDEQLESIAALRALLLARNSAQETVGEAILAHFGYSQGAGNSVHQGTASIPFTMLQQAPSGQGSMISPVPFFATPGSIPESATSVHEDHQTLSAAMTLHLQDNSLSDGDGSQASVNRRIQEALQQTNVVAPTSSLPPWAQSGAPRGNFVPFHS